MAENATDHTHDAFPITGLALFLVIVLVLVLFGLTNHINDIGHEELFERVNAIEVRLDCPIGEVFTNRRFPFVSLEGRIPISLPF